MADSQNLTYLKTEELFYPFLKSCHLHPHYMYLQEYVYTYSIACIHLSCAGLIRAGQQREQKLINNFSENKDENHSCYVKHRTKWKEHNIGCPSKKKKCGEEKEILWNVFGWVCFLVVEFFVCLFVLKQVRQKHKEVDWAYLWTKIHAFVYDRKNTSLPETTKYFLYLSSMTLVYCF